MSGKDMLKSNVIAGRMNFLQREFLARETSLSYSPSDLPQMATYVSSTTWRKGTMRSLRRRRNPSTSLLTFDSVRVHPLSPPDRVIIRCCRHQRGGRQEEVKVRLTADSCLIGVSVLSVAPVFSESS